MFTIEYIDRDDQKTKQKDVAASADWKAKLAFLQANGWDTLILAVTKKD